MKQGNNRGECWSQIKRRREERVRREDSRWRETPVNGVERRGAGL